MSETLTWAGHANACAIGETVIVLDLRADRYWAFAQNEGACADLVDANGAPLRFGASTLEALRARGLVAAPAPPRLGAPAPLGAQAPSPTQLRARASMQGVMRACLWAHWAMQRGRLERAIATLAREKASSGGRDGGAHVAMFERWRPLFPRDCVCLFDSLSLMRFLLSAGAEAAFTIGVRTHPFAAHAWVSIDGTPVNDRLGQAASFAPILRI